jgi:hypothetical protein
MVDNADISVGMSLDDSKINAAITRINRNVEALSKSMLMLGDSMNKNLIRSSTKAVNTADAKLSALVKSNTAHIKEMFDAAEKQMNQRGLERFAEAGAVPPVVRKTPRPKIADDPYGQIASGPVLRVGEDILRQERARNALIEKRNKVLALEEKAALKATEDLRGSLGGIRYALYDVANTAAVAGAALLAAVIIPSKAAIDIERQFADVARTAKLSGDDVARYRQEFVKLSQEIPVAFSKLSEIGTLAGQLNISKTALTNFTENVAKFSATTDVSVSDSATAFGRLGELIDGVNGRYDKLGSAILAVGTNSVATESQIINTAQQIASLGNSVGISADGIIALSGALASLGTSPELSRGLVTRLFENINRSVTLGGEKLRDYDRLVL